MKKFIAVICIITILLFSGCYPSYKTYFTEVSDYQNIWSLPGFHHGYDDKSPLFPDNIYNLEVSEFQCRFDEQLPLGEAIQIFLKITHPKGFDDEIARISSVAHEDTENFTNSVFPAYSIRMGENDSFEYALIDENEKAVYYIFLHGYLPAKEIEIDERFLPNNLN